MKLASRATLSHKRWYCGHEFTRDAQALLEAFEHLGTEEKRVLPQKVLHRSLPFDSGFFTDGEIRAGSNR